MLTYFNKRFDYKALTELVGDFSQLAGTKRYQYTTGRSKGVEAVDIRTGAGLSYTILADRALDIGQAEYKGMPLAFMTPAGVVSPQYYNPDGKEWLRSFAGGLMTTCGLSNVGDASELDGIKYGQHGRISNLPGENICVEEEFHGSEYRIEVKGKVRQTKSFVENMVMHRTIWSVAGENAIHINDVIENRTFTPQPLMLLYHFNFGFPLLNEHSKIILPVMDIPKPELERLNHFICHKPGQHTPPNTPVHLRVNADADGYAYFLLLNDHRNPELAVQVKFGYAALQNLIIWKSLEPGNYALCIEPANCHIKGISQQQREGTLEYLQPFEKRNTDIEIRILDDKQEILSVQTFLENLFRANIDLGR